MRLFDVIAVTALFSLSIVLALVFYTAFFNGDQVVVCINNYHEAVAEAVAIPVLLIMGAITIVRMLRMVKGGN